MLDVGARYRRIVGPCALVLALLTVACGSGAGVAADDPDQLKIVTTVSPITSIVASVAGDLVEVRGLVPEGVNSHTFEPPPSAARTLVRADVVFVNGLKLEDPTRELAADNLKAGAEVVELGDRTIRPDQYLYDFSFPREGGKPNPHLWTNPPYAKEYARVVRDTLVRRDPTHAGEYTANFERFASKVDELDGAMLAATVTVARRELLTYHDAYAYFARHYGWKVIGAVQVSSFEEPTPREVAGLIQQVRQVGVPAVFGSEVFPSKVLAQIGTEAGVRYVDTLRDDDLPGRPGDPDHSWLGLMKFDFVTMVESLGGEASALKAVQPPAGPPDRAVYPQ